MLYEIAVIGFGTMGKNIVLNMLDKGYKVLIYDIDHNKTKQFALSHSNVKAVHSIKEISNNLIQPRKILLLVSAGNLIDNIIKEIKPYLNKNDIIIDGGNSHFRDSERRYNELFNIGIKFIGMGISGGALGARYGPSLMVGGDKSAWDQIKNILMDIAAEVNNKKCVALLGDKGAGHLVKTIHNGIEYVIMQAISESYQLMRFGLGYNLLQISKIFSTWNTQELESYLIEITAKILKRDVKDNLFIDNIDDAANQKGTGRWSAEIALELGSPATLINRAVLQRSLSSYKNLRNILSSKINNIGIKEASVKDNNVVEKLKKALYLVILIAFEQGHQILYQAKNIGYKFNFSNIFTIWRGGCIIRASLLENLSNISENEISLLDTGFYIKEIGQNIESLHDIVNLFADTMIPGAIFSDAYFYLLSMFSKNLPTNLIQAQRNYFGQHPLKLKDN